MSFWKNIFAVGSRSLEDGPGWDDNNEKQLEVQKSLSKVLDQFEPIDPHRQGMIKTSIDDNGEVKQEFIPAEMMYKAPNEEGGKT